MGIKGSKDVDEDRQLDAEDIMPAGFYSSVVTRPEGDFNLSASVGSKYITHCAIHYLVGPC